MERRNSRRVTVGDRPMGGGAPIWIQSMTNTDTHDTSATLEQILRLRDAGCQIVRLAVPDLEAAETFRFLKSKDIGIPLVADIHFDYRIALRCIEAGADKIRINPGNIGSEDRVRAVADACRARKIPIRIGVNGGSLEKDLLEKYGGPTAEAVVESALRHVALLEKYDFYDTVISVKLSDVPRMIEANRLLAERTEYPLHLGVTEAGGIAAGTVKSAIGIGTLLAEGIGDTIRVSLTADPVEEVAAAKQILRTLQIGKGGLDIVSCPTCGRTRIDLISLCREFEEKAKKAGIMDKPLKVALMGCVVNGPGEAKEADIGIAGGLGDGIVFRRGEVLGRVPEGALVDTLIEYIRNM